MVRYLSNFVMVLAAGLLFNPQASANVPGDVELKLGTTASFNFQISQSQAGEVKFAVDRTDLDQIAGAKKIQIMVIPEVVILKANQPVDIVFKINVPTDSPSFAPVKVGVNMATIQGIANIGETMFGVKPIYEMYLKGGSPEVWSGSKTASFVSHKDGVTVRFLNMDKTKSHTIHSGGAIPHQDGSLSPANEQGPVGSYDTVVKASTVSSKAGVYCHEHEGFGDNRTLVFNVQQ